MEANCSTGTDPSNHYGGPPGAGVLIDNAIKFAAAGASTGLYFALSHYYDTVDNAIVTSLSEFGDFEVRGNLQCYNVAHIVATSPALATLTDAALSNWDCSVHEAFSVYPQTGLGSFQALAIAKDIIGAGSQTFGDGTVGLPYIISRGATPAACGNGIFEPQFGEECDDGNTVDGDGCSSSCKCESGRPDGKGKCLPKLTTGTGGISGPVSATPVKYGNSTITTTVTA
jgi:cysteine-rich repeat protein